MFGYTGTFKRPELVPKDLSFENAVTEIRGAEKRTFIEFVKRMIKWDPCDRSTAKELLEDPWLCTDFPQQEE